MNVHLLLNPKGIVKSLIFLLILLIDLGSFAQELPINNVVLPPSPDASSLGKFGDYQVSEFTGLPNISVPIFDAKLKDYTLPVSLSYHPSGIKVDEIASLVGMGWALNAGGQITRVVRGRPDEETTFGFQATGSKFHLPISPTSNATNFDLFEKFAYGLYDSELDEYFYSFGDKSGKFVIGLNNKPVILVNDNIKIENLGVSFVITDEYGRKFFFNDRETTRPEVPGDLHMIEYTSTWHLSKIENANGIVLFQFTYEDYFQRFETGKSETKLEKLFGTCPIGKNYFQSINEINVNGRRLKKIAFSGGSVEFFAELSRKDITGNALTKVNVYSNSQLLKSFNLEYFYHSQRLFLDKISEIGLNGSKPKITKFNYNSSNLPERLSFSQDHWGYFGNGNTTLIPQMEYNGISYNGADRNPTSNTIAGTLESIIHPTGGATKFVFENNDYYISGTKLIDAGTGMRQRCSTQGNRVTRDTARFYVEFAQQAITNLHYSYNNDMCLGGSGAYYTLTHDDGSTVNIMNGVGYKINIKEGYYTLIGVLECEFCTDFRADFSISFKKRHAFEVNEFGPALRVREIINYTDSLNTIADRWEYSYRDTADSRKSTGTIFSKPSYGYTYSEKLPPYEGVGTCQYFARTSSSVSELGSCRGGLVGYSTVTKRHYDPVLGYQGKIVSFYKVNTVRGSSRYPFPPNTDLDHKNGMLEKELIYDNNNNLLQEITNSYQLNQSSASETDNFVNGLKVAFETKSYMTGINGGNGFQYAYYSYSTKWNSLIKTVTKKYDLKGEASEETVDYEYKNSYVFPAITKKTNSKGAIAKISTYFPIDYSDQEPYGKMLGKNMLKVEVKSEYFLSDNAMEINRLHYKDVGGSKIVAERSVKTNKNNDVLANFVILKHDRFLNPQEIQNQAGPIITYLWGNEGQYPIAEIKNASFKDVEEVLTQSVIDNLNSPLVTDATVDAAMKKLRAAPKLAQAMVTSYTYKPLVGMTSKTDARGIKKTYTYDGMQRLQAILDHVGYVTKAIDYHYRPN